MEADLAASSSRPTHACHADRTGLEGSRPVVLLRNSARDQRSVRLAGSDLRWSDAVSHHIGEPPLTSRPADNVRLEETEPREVLAGARSQPTTVVEVDSATKLVPIASRVVIERGGNGEGNG